MLGLGTQSKFICYQVIYFLNGTENDNHLRQQGNIPRKYNYMVWFKNKLTIFNLKVISHKWENKWDISLEDVLASTLMFKY